MSCQAADVQMCKNHVAHNSGNQFNSPFFKISVDLGTKKALGTLTAFDSCPDMCFPRRAVVEIQRHVSVAQLA